MKKDYRQELLDMYERLHSKKHFAFTKFADGELAILRGERVGNAEFQYVPGEESSIGRHELWNSFKYRHDDYYIGIISPDFSEVIFSWMKSNSSIPETNLTFCDIFVNSNYNKYLELFIPEYQQRDVVLVCSEKANINTLPFTPEKVFRVGHTALDNSFGVLGDIIEWIDDNKVENKLFLFCAGPFGNVLTYQLFRYCKKNTYLDIGSTIDPLLSLGTTRRYLQTGNDRVCVWE